jgi:hypothetical protein
LRNVETDIDQHIADILEQLKNEFTASQINALFDLVDKAAVVEGNSNEAQKRTRKCLRDVFNRKNTEQDW